MQIIFAFKEDKKKIISLELIKQQESSRNKIRLIEIYEPSLVFEPVKKSDGKETEFENTITFVLTFKLSKTLAFSPQRYLNLNEINSFNCLSY